MKSKPKVPIDKILGAATIELQRVSRCGGETLVVAFTDSQRMGNWEIACKAKDLQSFGAFQRLVADQLGLWIDHSSQHYHRAWKRRDDWQFDVSSAFERGTAK